MQLKVISRKGGGPKFSDEIPSHLDHDVHDDRVLASFTLCLGTPSNPEESWSASLKMLLKRIQKLINWIDLRVDPMAHTTVSSDTKNSFNVKISGVLLP